MERTEFNGLFKDLMTHIYDFAALENHPLVQVVEVPANLRISRGNYIQQIIFEEIERFQPVGKQPSVDAIEWRPYLILQKRYVEGMGLQDLASFLAISKRQMRRDHSRALQALAGRMWDRVFREKLGQPDHDHLAQENDLAPAFDLHPEILDISAVLQGVIFTLERHIKAEEIELDLELTSDLVLTDRIILRQILISLFNYAIHIQCDNHIHLKTSLEQSRVVVAFEVAVDRLWRSWADDENDDLLGTAKLWSTRLNAELADYNPPNGEAGSVRLILSLPVADQGTILVVDDQHPTIQMYQRYLSRSNYKVIGISDPSQAYPMVRQLQPDLILLDVMMPQIDGWEILQALQQDDKTRHIPVIVCSAWETWDLAKSLGAADFLKKPITKEGLLLAIRKLVAG